MSKVTDILTKAGFTEIKGLGLEYTVYKDGSIYSVKIWPHNNMIQLSNLTTGEAQVLNGSK